MIEITIKNNKTNDNNNNYRTVLIMIVKLELKQRLHV